MHAMFVLVERGECRGRQGTPMSAITPFAKRARFEIAAED
jgi:hypothetical protein